jgi:type I restriction enzyme S subunit
MADLSTPTNEIQSGQTAESLITQNIDIWTTAIERKSSAGRGTSNKFTLYGIKKLRELILELAVRGKLVPQDVNDEPALILLERIATEKAQLVKDKEIKKPKALPEIGEDEKPFELPVGWVWSRLGILSYKLTDGSHNPARDNGDGYPMLSGQNVNYGRIDFDNPSRYVDELNFVKENSRTQIEPKDILLTIVGSIGRSAVVPTNAPKFVLQRSVAVIQTCLKPEFLCNQFISPICINYYDEHGKGTAQKGIYLGQLSLMPIAVPPLEEQHRIVAKVDELMSLCDALEAQTEDSIAAHQTLVETLLNALLLPNTTQSADSQSASPEPSFADSLEPALNDSFVDSWQRVAEHFDTLFTTEASIDTLKQTILQLAVMGKLVEQDENDEPAAKLLERIAAEKAQLIKDGKIKKKKPLPAITDEKKPFELPNSWEWVCWGDLLAYDDAAFKRGPFGSSLTKSMFINKGYKVYEQYCPINDDCSFERYYISDEKFEELKGFAVKSGDFLVSCTGATLGRITQVPRQFKEGVINQALLRVRINNDVFDAEFFKLLFRSPFFQRSIFANSKGSAIPNLKGVNDLKAMTIPFCSINEQHRIVAKVVELMALCEQLKARLSDAQTTQLHLTDAIVEQAI